ncbi:MAG TPA: polyphosphate kinase 1, partial [Candidatus Ozemobacteraceae bacterium]|nr:polyphosphate kinase 1 [Candidatus Ozemobacteraceae bacterium]
MPRQRPSPRPARISETPSPAHAEPITPAVTLPAGKSRRSAQIGPRFFNRELSWLEFNRRVLDEACDRELPLLERLKFLAITASNLDEFFMVRVGGLRRQIGLGLGAKPDPSGMTVAEQLQAIGRAVRRFVTDQYALLADDLEPKLAQAGIHRYPIERLTRDHLDHLERIFDQEIFPVITPMAIASPAEFPLLPGLGLNLIVRLTAPKGAKQSYRFAVIPLPRSLPRFVALPGEIGYQFVLLEEVILLHLERLFPGEPICESIPFRITRNADLTMAEDEVDNFLEEMEEVLDARRQSPCIRLEIDRRCPGSTLSFLKDSLQIQDDQIFHMTGPLHLGAFMALAGMAGFDEYKVESWTPQSVPEFSTGATTFEVIARNDVLLFHPMQSYDPVVQFIEEAADDPDVLAIKGTLYRTSARSPIVGALARAAACDKHVTALVELKARFDEARNIEWARELERAGVQVIYGIKGLKTHAKCFIVVRREADGIRRYIHFGTGNYNEATARVYCDVSLFTAAEDFGLDASQFFNAITGYSQPLPYRQISAAPLGLRERLLGFIQSEAERSRQGQEARI